MTASRPFLERLDQALGRRQIAEGIRLLDANKKQWRSGNVGRPDGAAIVLRVAQWVDVGYSDHRVLDELLAEYGAVDRSAMPVGDYLRLRLAESFRAMMVEDADRAIDLLNFVLQAGEELRDDRFMVLAHFWAGRAHRKKGEYETAAAHIVEARQRATAMGAARLAAVIQVQEAWLIFQKGSAKDALRSLDEAQEQLRSTDDAISLGNIESARGRIVRRSGEYSEALAHYDRAIAIYGERDPSHRNLARTLVNSAYVLRLLALHLRKRIDARSAQPRSSAKSMRPAGRSNHARYAQMCRDALKQLDRAGAIYRLHHHHGGEGSVLVNTGQLHLDMGALDKAADEAEKAYVLGSETHDSILMARARILEAHAENARVDEQMGEDSDIAICANAAKRYGEEAVDLAKHTQNLRLLAGAYLVCGFACANEYFEQWDEANQYASRAAALLRADDRDHLWEELISLKAKVLRASGMDETLRGWSEGIVGDKSFQQITEEFAEIVIPKVWAREDKKIARVATKLSISPKKVRRVLRNLGLLD